MDVLTMVFKEFLANQMKKEGKPSIKAQLKTLNEQVTICLDDTGKYVNFRLIFEKKAKK